MPRGRPKKRKFPIVQNDVSLEEQQPGQSNVTNDIEFNLNIQNRIEEIFVEQPGPSNAARPIRKAKAKGMEKISEVIMILNESQSQEHLDQMQRINAHRIANENDEERNHRLEQDRNRYSQRIANENYVQRNQRLEGMRQRASQRIANENNAQQNQRLEDMRQRASQRIANENDAQQNQRLEDMRQRASQRIANENDAQQIQRLEDIRQRASQRIANENDAQRNLRLEEQRRRNVRRQRAMAQNAVRTYKDAVNYASVNYKSLGPFNVVCFNCGALHFPEERVANKGDSFGDCCLHGRIVLPPPQFPNELVCLFLRRHPLANEFHKRIRNLNSCFALASFNVSDDRTINNRHIFSFKAAGQVYHKMNMAAHPTQTTQGDFEPPSYGQMYFLDSDDAVDERLAHPLNYGISRELMDLLEEILREQNIYAQSYMRMREVEDDINQCAAALGLQPPNVQLIFTVPDGVDYRRFNPPACNEVCVVLTLNADQSFPSNEMVVKQRGKDVVILKNIDHRVEPFTYPLFYPAGTSGYTVGMPLRIPYASRPHLTRLELAQYRIAFRPEHAKSLSLQTNLTPDLRQTVFNALHFGGRLFQQYLVDTFIRVERDRIQWIKFNQKTILADQYAGVTRLINDLAEKQNAVVGEKIILPSSFTGSTRYYTEHFEDAMAIVRRLGSPDFFITMTCNPDWPEIKEAARIISDNGVIIQQSAQDRPDLVARIAKQKFDEIINDLDKKQIFGKVAAYVYTIEFQKRGLPHMHLLLIMNPEDRIHNPEEIDDLISAEIPNTDDPKLRELVLKWMIHNPCGVELNADATCMVNKNGKLQCRFGFPMQFKEVTSLADDEKPKYRRRYNPKLDQNNREEFSHELAIYRKDKHNRRVTRDNRHVATYNAYLLKKFQCHINVEYVGRIGPVKYLYKYIYKGHDCASIKVVENQRSLIYNEADTYVEGRCITPPEACWRLLGHEIQKKSHIVQRLNIHLRGQYRMQDIDQAQEDLADIGQNGSMLEAYFRHNQALKQMQTKQNYYYYWQMPEHFKWNGKTSTWEPRIRRLRVIGRIHNVNYVAQPECFHLRVLLYHVKDATSFDDLLTVNDIRYATYKQACLAHGLAFDDKQWIDGLEESALSKIPSVMRILFVQILIFGCPEDPKGLWERFKNQLAEDFILQARRNNRSEDAAIKRAYRIIAFKLNTTATEGRNFRFWLERYGMDDIDNYEDDQNMDVLNSDESAATGERMYRLLQGKQIEIVDSILRAANDSNYAETKCFFIDGPGGTGKTYVYKTLYHLLCGQNRKVKCMAFTGIASTLLPAGQTSHKTFGLKVPLSSDSISSIKPNSVKATELAQVDVFLMDEAPMLPKYGLQNMDQLLRSIANPNLPFGGKILVAGGDFRQCLPVQLRSNRSETLDLSIKKSHLWMHFKNFLLKKNMRVDPEQEAFASYILKLGNGNLPKNDFNEIELPEDIISSGNLIEEVFGNCLANHNYDGMKERVILAPLNKEVSNINAEIVDRLPGEYKSYKSYDSVKDKQEGGIEFTPEFLNSIEIADLPPHELKLKTNTIIMLMRNLDISEGMCNGTRLIVTELCNNVVKAKLITGEKAGQEVHIPRVTLDSSKGQLGCTIQRHQFPLRPAFAITVHKSQGQTFEFVGVDLRTPVFNHGMLYVAFSRVKRQNSLKVLLPPENERRTYNVVWKEALNAPDESYISLDSDSNDGYLGNTDFYVSAE